MKKALSTMKPYKVIILILCLALTSIFIYRTSTSTAVKKQVPLTETLADIKGWSRSGSMPLDQEILKALELDDYVNHSYSNGKDTVSLYIGYYLTSKKVGAAHSPLVCFPGQGWVLSESEGRSLKIGDDKINLIQMVASIGPRKELLIYWFQAYDRTSPGTFIQKLNTLWSKFINGRVDNAFVRVTIPLGKKSKKQAFATGKAFIESFYPRFLEYVKENQS